MKLKLVNALIILLITTTAGNLFSEETVTVEKGQIIGKISKTKGSKEINVLYPANIASKIKMGTKLYVVSQKDGQPVIIELDVTFPMMSQTKVKISGSSAKYASLITDKAEVFLSAKLVHEEKIIPLPEDSEIAIKMREYIAETLISWYASNNQKCNTFTGPGKIFLKPNFKEPWKKFTERCVKVKDNENNIKLLEMASGQIHVILQPLRFFYSAAEEQLKSEPVDPSKPPVELTREYLEIRFLGQPLTKKEDDYMRHYDPKTLDALGTLLYPRNKMFGKYSGNDLYNRYSYHLRFMARLAVMCDKDKVLQKKITDTTGEWVYGADNIETIIKKYKIPAIHSSERGTVTHQFVKFYARRSVDGTMPVILKYMWMAFRDFDYEFYNQPDIKAFGQKIQSIQASE